MQFTKYKRNLITDIVRVPDTRGDATVTCFLL